MKSMALLVWLAAAALAAFGLFHVKHEVSAIEHQLSQAQSSITERREAIHILEAEWSYLNQPARIAELSRRHLELTPMGPEKVLDLDDLPPRVQALAAAEQGNLDGKHAKAGEKK